jgi:hypothetical protein
MAVVDWPAAFKLAAVRGVAMELIVEAAVVAAGWAMATV